MPDVVAEALLYLAKITIWCHVQQGRHRPHLFEDVCGDTQAVNDQRNQTVLVKFWRTLKGKLKNDPEILHCQWFQHGGATAHTA